MDDEIHHIRRAAIGVSVNHRAVTKVRAIRVAKFKRDHARRIVAQKTLPLGAQFAAHIRSERALAARDSGLVETNVTLTADQRKLHRVEDGGLAHAVDADEVRRAVTGDGGVFEQMPVDEADAG